MGRQQAARAMAEGRSLGSLKGLGHADFEKLYALGHSLYERDRHDDAADVFALLNVYEPTAPRFWFARGAAEQQRRNLGAAIAAYSIAALLDDEDPWPLVHLGECLLLVDRREQAVAALRRAAARAATEPGARRLAEGLLRWEEVHRAG